MTPTPSTELIIVRHGETEWNVDGRMQGHADSNLTPRGLRQAEAVARRLVQENIEAIYTSDLGRAIRTAQLLGRAKGLVVIPDTRLRERNMGVFQSLTVEEMRRGFPREYDRFASRQADYVIPGGESMQQCHERVIECLQSIADRHPGRKVAVVTHGGPLSAAFRHTMQLPVNAPRRWSLFNASMNRFEVQEAKWQLALWGDLSHLDGLTSEDDF
ncbi:MAG: histidine phosphatase family protein [Phycisphaerae bacterium]